MTDLEKRERIAWKIRRRRQLHRRNGICLECTRAVVSGKKCCSVHLAKARTKSKQEYDWRTANGVCIKCGIPKEEGRTAVNCLSCADKAAAKERRRRALSASHTAAAFRRALQGREFGLASADAGDHENRHEATQGRQQRVA